MRSARGDRLGRSATPSAALHAFLSAYLLNGLKFSEDVWGSLETAELVPTTSSIRGSGSGKSPTADAVRVRGVTYSKEGKPIVRTVEFQNKQLE